MNPTLEVLEQRLAALDTVRLSLGIEHIDDLIADLDRVLAVV